MRLNLHNAAFYLQLVAPDHQVIDEVGNGSVTGQRLYQLVRQKGGSKERLFTIEFLDPGAEAYAFTFG